MKILIIDELHPALKKGLILLGHEVSDQPTISVSDLPEALRQTEALVVRSRFHITKEIINWAPQLKIIARAGAGMDNVDQFYAEHKGILCIHAAGANAISVSEHVIGMLLSLFNKLHTADREIRNHLFDRERNRGIELYGKTFGIIGYGHTGSAVAERVAAFGCQVLAYDKYKKNFGNGQVTECSLDRLFQEADIISFHVPLTPETTNMGNHVFFSQFKKYIYVINASRGKVICMKDLLEGLDRNILGAALDVLENERLPELSEPEQIEFNALIQKQNVILSPHVAGWTAESFERISICLLQKFKDILDT